MKYFEIQKTNGALEAKAISGSVFIESKDGRLYVQHSDTHKLSTFDEGKWCRFKPVPKARRPTSFLMVPLVPSEELAQIVGHKPLMRTEVIKKVWAFIKKNNLQDQKNKRNILVGNNNLTKEIFGGREVVSMFEMTKILSGHLTDRKALNAKKKN
jgi:upstream activation factor subunit UAF30